MRENDAAKKTWLKASMHFGTHFCLKYTFSEKIVPDSYKSAPPRTARHI